MFNKKSTFKLVLPLLIAVAIVLISICIYRMTAPVVDINTIWVINLDKDKERLTNILGQQDRLPLPIQRWSAAYGKEENRRKIAAEDGVLEIISRSSNNDENKQSDKVLQRAGEIGCWLSHKRLLKHLSQQNYPPDYGHLICEDDVIVDPDFNKKWDGLKKNIPSDWEIIYFGIGGAHGDKISDGILKWKNDIRAANWGTFSYMIRQKSIKKVLGSMILMGGPIDVQYYKSLGHMNIYILTPNLINATEDLGSSIDDQEKRFRAVNPPR